MSRLDDALRRARPTATEPDSFHVPSARALDWFAPADSAAPAAPAAVAPAAPEKTAPAPQPRAAAAAVVSLPANVLELPDEHQTTDIGPADTKESTVPVEICSEHAHRLIVSSEAQPIAIEQYRRIAAVLHHVQRDRGVRVVMISSAIPGEGKTLTASNLALTISESYHRSVLLIDADLRRPMVHQTFGVSNANGLSTMLESLTDVKPALIQVTPYLTVLPAGEPNPDPLSGLTSQRMKRLIAEAREHFDWVLIDTPPVGVLSDANLLSAIVDAAILVVGAGKTPLKMIQDAVNAVGRDRILGVVLNRVTEESLAGHYGGYGYGYGYSGKKAAGYFAKKLRLDAPGS
jgi:capsular exopolysaccharide synthesis family protein